jgi:hypothetical protein
MIKTPLATRHSSNRAQVAAGAVPIGGLMLWPNQPEYLLGTLADLKG